MSYEPEYPPREGHIDKAEHVGGLAVEVFHATRDAALEQFELKAHVEVGVGLPCDVGVAHGVLHECHLAVEVAEIVGVGVTIVADSVVALLSPRSLQLEHVDPRRLEPRLLRQYPSAAERVEVAPAMVGMEA